jgi:hypothetical protein
MAKPEGHKYLGIYVSPKEIVIAQVKVGKEGRPVPEHFVKFPTGFSVKEGMLRPLSLNHEFFSEKAPWLAPFKQAMKTVSWDTSKVVVSLSQQFSILRYFVMPMVERRFWSKSIPLESKKYIPVSFEEVVYDYSAVPADGGKKLGVLFGLTQRKSVEFIINTLKANGLELAAVEISSVSMERLFGFADKADHDVKGYIHFSGNSTLMLFSHGGSPVLYRESETDSSGTMSERRRLDVNGGMQFVDRYVGGKEYKTIMLSGDGAEAWKPAAEREAAPIPVEIWDVAKACSLKDNDATSLFAIGAALRGRVDGSPLLDISGISTAANLEKQVQSYVWNVTFIVGGFLLLMSLITQTRLIMVNSRLSSVAAQIGNSDLVGNDADAIKAKMDRIQANVKVLSMIVTDVDPLAPKLSAMAERIPADLWVEDVMYSSPISVSDVQSASTDLKFTGETYLKGDAKVRVVDAFTKALKGAPEYKSFTPPFGNIDFTNDSEASQGMAAPGMIGQPEGPRASGFSIMCSSKRK